MINISPRTRTGKVCKIDPKKAVVKKKGILSLTLHDRFGIYMRENLQNDKSLDLPVIQNRRNSLSSTQNKIEGFDPIAKVQAVPLTANIVLKQFFTYLTKFEAVEILDYKEIHFLGMKANKTLPDNGKSNFGYDDERSDYKIVIGDHLAYRYEILQVIGKGAFGQVCMSFDHKNKETIAIKIIRNQARFHKQGRIEIKILNLLKNESDQNNIVTILDHFVFRKHLCICFELLSVNFYEMLKINSFHGFSQNFIKKIAKQLLVCLKSLKNHQIIHCDLKPENILLKKNQKKGEIKVIDFGSSCFYTEKVHSYIQSRFYRAPEIILGISYNEAIDIWSLGCIISELSLGYPLFPGESETEQLLCIMEVKGLPPENIIDRATKKKNYFDGHSPKLVANSRGKRRHPGTKFLENILKTNDPNFVNFVECKF